MSAIEALDRLPSNEWDEDVRLLRAEALIGLGRIPEADVLLGAPILPIGRSDDKKREQRPKEPTPEVVNEAATRPLLPRGQMRAFKRHYVGRKERNALWRFLLQLRVLHRTGNYRQVLQLGRAFFGTQKIQPNIFVARIATVVAQSTYALRRPSEAREMYEDVLELYKQLHSREGVADTVLGIANTQLQDCRWDEADALYQEARFRYEEMGQSDKALAAMINLGVLRGKRGDLAGGRSLLHQALTRAGQMGEAKRTTTILLALGWIEIRTGHSREALGHLLQAIRQGKRMNSPRTHALALEYLGEMYMLAGRTKRARVLLREGLRLARSISPTGDLVFEIRRRQAEVAVADRSFEEARVLAMESIQCAREFGDLYEAAVTERVLAACDEANGNLARAAERVRSACESLDRLGETYERARFELTRVRLDALLGELSADVAASRVPAVTRPFMNFTDAPVMREARRLLERLPDQKGKAPARTPIPVEATADPLPRITLTASEVESAGRLGLVGHDAEFQNALVLARLAAPLGVPVLLIGEAGTGKSSFARLIHLWSQRAGHFIFFRCAELAESVIAAELFGEGPGNGGLLSAANSGTLFLDEITELPPAIQRRLLAWIEDNENSDRVRLIGATKYGVTEPSRNGSGGMRAALSNVLPGTLNARNSELRRLVGRVTIALPSLHARRTDLPILMQYFADQTRQRFGLAAKPLPDAMVRFFAEHQWPGNARELRQAVERFVLAEAESGDPERAAHSLGIDSFTLTQSLARSALRGAGGSEL